MERRQKEIGMVTQLTDEQTGAPPAAGLGKQIWVMVAQCVTILLTVLALYWATTLTSERPVISLQHQVLLGVLAAVALVVALVPKWRRGEAAAILGGVTLATACWLASEKTWDIPFFEESGAYIPLLVPVVAGAAVVMAVWGLIARAGFREHARLGLGAVVSGAVVALFAGGYYLLINRVPAFKLEELNYAINPNQLQEELAILMLYPLALWLGGIGIRRYARIIILPAGLALVLVGCLIWWHVR